MRKSRLEKFRNMILIIAIFSAFLSSLYFFFRIRNYMIASCFCLTFLLLVMLRQSNG